MGGARKRGLISEGAYKWGGGLVRRGLISGGACRWGGCKRGACKWQFTVSYKTALDKFCRLCGK